MEWKASVVAAMVLLFFITPAYATPVYGTVVQFTDFSGTRSVESGITSGGSWSAFNLSWSISPLNSGWSVRYSFTGFPSPGISYLLLELSANCLVASSGCVQSARNDGALIPSGDQIYGNFVSGSGYPGMPAGASIRGIRFDIGGTSPEVYSFWTPRNLVWGNFYLKGGSTSVSYAYNTGLSNQTVSDIANFVPVPDSTSDIPEPATYGIVGVGFSGLWLFRRRRSE